jgi:indolepyruvate decarboxylase
MTTRSVGDYLLDRLHELGVHHLFGVPGDYVLGFNAQIEARPDLAWVANCNELNAAYAAEGYARANGIGAFVVTAGVGDLGAASGVCGALAEHSSVVVISGVPGVSRPGATHHTAGDGDFSRFERIYAEITLAHTTLTESNAAAEIDRVLRTCVMQHGPVFIALPADVAPAAISAPAGPLDLSAGTTGDLERLAAAVTDRLATARQPVVLVDTGLRQSRLADAFAAAVAGGHISWAVTSAAVADVTGPPGPGYLGVYPGGFGHRSAAEVDDADLLIRLGVRRVERAGSRAVLGLRDPAVVDVGDARTTIGTEVFDVPMAQAIETIAAALTASSRLPADLADPTRPADPGRADTTAPDRASAPADGGLTQDAFFAELLSYLQPDDVVLVDPGSGMFPMTSRSRPDGVTLYNQKTWAAIGWALPATLGAALAAPDRRHILIIGDGALAMTVQELSTLAREGCSPLVIVVNNGGYLIEDFAIYGLKLDCDDIWVWDYAALAGAFDDRRRHRPLGLQVTTAADVAEALKKAAEGQLEGRLVVLDAVFGRDDMNESMRAMHEARMAAVAASPDSRP